MRMADRVCNLEGDFPSSDNEGALSCLPHLRAKRPKYDMVAAKHTLNLMRVYWPADTSEPVLEQTIGTVLRVAAKTHGAKTVLVESELRLARKC
jgi:hypothetical protein